MKRGTNSEQNDNAVQDLDYAARYENGVLFKLVCKQVWFGRSREVKNNFPWVSRRVCQSRLPGERRRNPVFLLWRWFAHIGWQNSLSRRTRILKGFNFSRERPPVFHLGLNCALCEASAYKTCCTHYLQLTSTKKSLVWPWVGERSSDAVVMLFPAGGP